MPLNGLVHQKRTLSLRKALQERKVLVGVSVRKHEWEMPALVPVASGMVPGAFSPACLGRVQGCSSAGDGSECYQSKHQN